MDRVAAVVRARSAEYWRQIATLVFSVVAGGKAILSFGNDDFSPWTAAGITLLVVVSLLAHRYIWQEERKRTPVAVGAPDELTEANASWLAEPGRVVIVTRDMSWSMADGVREALLAKSRRGEVTAFVWVETQALSELRLAGADVRVVTGDPPRVRFTVLRWGASDERVLVHRQAKGKIEFYEVTSTDFPAYWLANDIVDLLRRSQVSAG